MVLKPVSVCGRLLGLLVVSITLAGCGDDSHATEPVGRPQVWTASWPIWSLTWRLAGDAAQLHCALPTDTDVEGFSPPRDVIAAMASGDLVLLSGAGLEAWTGRVSLPTGRVVDTSAGFADQFVDFPEQVSHSHGGGVAHAHEGTNPHVWLDPVLLERQARAIHEGLVRVLPDRKATLDGKLGELIEELRALDLELKGIALGPDDVLVASHPTWVYLARRYGWTLVDAHLHNDEAPDAENLAALVTAVGGRRVRAVLFEVVPIEAVRAALRGAVDAPCVAFDPDVRRSADDGVRDTIAVLRAGVASLRGALR